MSRSKIQKIVRTVLSDTRLVSVGGSLLAMVLIRRILLPIDWNPILSELDNLEHFLFGFVLSDFSSTTAHSFVDETSRKKSEENGSVHPRKKDLLIRLLGFFLIGGVLWELSELHLFTLFGSKPDPFFNYPITLANIDGTIDVTVGCLGCLLAWYTANED